MSSRDRVVGIAQEYEVDGRLPRNGQRSGSATSEVEEVVLERVAVGDLFVQTVLADRSKARVVAVVLDELATNVGGEGETEVVAPGA